MSIKSQGHYPGTISRVPSEGHYPGTKTVWFWTVNGYDKFFQEEPGKPGKALVVVEARPVPYLFGLFVGVMATYTKQLSAEEEADYHEVTRRIEMEMADIRLKRAEQQAEQNAVAEAAKKEQARLALVGKKYEDRVSHVRSMAPSDQQRKDAEAKLNGGDPEVLFGNKDEAFKAGYVHGYEAGKTKDGE